MKVLFTIVSATKDSNLPLHSVSILRLAKLTWLHNCDIINRVEASKPYGGLVNIKKILQFL